MFERSSGNLFYQLTSQVLNDKNLNHAEKICITLLYGLSDEDGKSYPSNEWLQGKLDLKLRAVQNILENLEKNNYIKKEIVRCVNNPMKVYRIIYVNTNFKFSLPNAENCIPEDAENCIAAMKKTACIIDKKDIIDKKEPPNPQTGADSPSGSEWVRFGSHVHLKKSDYEKFCRDYLKENIDTNTEIR